MTMNPNPPPIVLGHLDSEYRTEWTPKSKTWRGLLWEFLLLCWRGK